MNTFENELSTKNLVSLLSCKEGVDVYDVDVEGQAVLCLKDMVRIDGPARILVVTD